MENTEDVKMGKMDFQNAKDSKGETSLHIKCEVENREVNFFACAECEKTFESKSNLKDHEWIHARPFPCSKCEKAFKCIYTLKVHEKNHKKEFACLKCDKAFNQINHLKRQERTHTGEKPFACSKCGRSYQRKGDLTKHEKTHTGEKSFACSKCSKAFFHKADLKRHMKTDTPDESFASSKCKTYYQKEDLKKHESTNKEHGCEKCTKTYTCLSHFESHQESQCCQDDQSSVSNSSINIENEMIFPEEIKQEFHACETCAKTFADLFDFERHKENQCLRINQESTNNAIVKIENEMKFFEEFKQEPL